MNSRVIYTAAFGAAVRELDGMPPPPPGWDFVVFHERGVQPQLSTPARLVPCTPASCNPRVAAKRYKIRPDLFLPDYDVSLYIDANVRLRGEVGVWLNELLKRDEDMLAFRHNRCKRVAGEWLRVLVYGKEDPRKWLSVWHLLWLRGVALRPCIQGGFILRHHHRSAVKALMSHWWALIRRYSERDQALLAAALRETPVRLGWIAGRLHDSEFTSILPHPNIRYSADGRIVNSMHQRILARYRHFRLQQHPRRGRRIRRIGALVTHMGLPWLCFRFVYALQLRLGLMARSYPTRSWDSRPLRFWLRDQDLAHPDAYTTYRRCQAPAFWIQPSSRHAVAAVLDKAFPSPARQSPAERMSEAIGAGKFECFGSLTLDFGFPPVWHKHPITRERLPSDRHWSRIPAFGNGDIKCIWEPSRFAFTYALIRAWWRSDLHIHPDRFWELTENWRAQNPPASGANWMCGQETAFRVMAWIAALYAFQDAPSTTPERVAMLATMIATAGERIEANFSYALSQQNNHGISEAAVLWAIGLLFPEFTRAATWRTRGRQALENQVARLVYDDGAFSQHSANYHRVFLHDCVWASRLARINGCPFSPQFDAHVASATEFLYQIMDETTGGVPTYGGADGALVLPLDACPFSDFRSVVQSAVFLTTQTRRFPPGPWDESLIWLFGPDSLHSPHVPGLRTDLHGSEGGVHTIRDDRGFLFLRCGRFRHRPAHADLLHADLWWNGLNIAGDPGTYSYHAQPPWHHDLAGTAVHNTLCVDGLDQMERVGRFMWLPWAGGTVCKHTRSTDGGLAYWQGTHDGYTRLRPPVRLRRAAISLGMGCWVVVDLGECRTERLFTLQWLLADHPHTYTGGENAHLTLNTSAGPYGLTVGTCGGFPARSTLVRADSRSTRGWRAAGYAQREPALSLNASLTTTIACFWSVFAPEPFTAVVTGHMLTLTAGARSHRVNITPAGEFLAERVVTDRAEPWIITP